MAKEIKSISVAPSAEEKTINLWQSFGWDLKSTQEIKTQDVQVYTGQAGDTKYYETKRGEHYIKLTFERDKTMPNYAELCDLENKYYAFPPQDIQEPHEPTLPDEPSRFGCGCGPIVFALVFTIFFSTQTNNDVGLQHVICFVTSLVLMLVVQLKVKYPKKRAEYEQKLEIWHKERAEWKTKCANLKEKRNNFMKMRQEILKNAKELLESGSEEQIITKVKLEQERVEQESSEAQEKEEQEESELSEMQEKKEREERERREAQEKKEREEREHREVQDKKEQEERKLRKKRQRKLQLILISIITIIVVIASYFNFSPTQTHNSKSDNNSIPEVDIYKSFTDSRDGKTYKIVTIGKQTWMAENLKYEMKGSKCYNHNPENCQKYGRLYNWEPALKACPSGWHLPKDYEWAALADYVGNGAGRKLKSKSGWDNNGNGTDEYGFSALPGGTGKSDGSFIMLGKYSYWWSVGNGKTDYYRYMSYEDANLSRLNSTKKGSFPIRCIKD